MLIYIKNLKWQGVLHSFYSGDANICWHVNVKHHNMSKKLIVCVTTATHYSVQQ